MQAQDLSGIYRDDILIFINDYQRPIPIRLMHDTKDNRRIAGAVIVASQYIDAYTEFKNPSKPTKIVVSVSFVCQPEYGKTEYHISLTDFGLRKGTLWSGSPSELLPVKSIPIKDFIVARCP